MSLGGNLSSGYTDSLIDKCITKPAFIAQSDKCCRINISGNPPVARYPSMVLASKVCPPPSPADFALYPKVAVQSSVRTQALGTSCASLPSPVQRFSQYQRFQVPVPCAPLPQSANMAGISKPSSLQCNIYPLT